MKKLYFSLAGVAYNQALLFWLERQGTVHLELLKGDNDATKGTVNIWQLPHPLDIQSDLGHSRIFPIRAGTLGLFTSLWGIHAPPPPPQIVPNRFLISSFSHLCEAGNKKRQKSLFLHLILKTFRLVLPCLFSDINPCYFLPLVIPKLTQEVLYCGAPVQCTFVHFERLVSRLWRSSMRSAPPVGPRFESWPSTRALFANQ